MARSARQIFHLPTLLSISFSKSSHSTEEILNIDPEHRRNTFLDLGIKVPTSIADVKIKWKKKCIIPIKTFWTFQKLYLFFIIKHNNWLSGLITICF